MSFMVNTCTRESRTATFSRSSRFLTPMMTVCAAFTFGPMPPKCASSDGSGPSSAASGMPCTLPLNEVAGVFMSPCASIHNKPIGRPLRPPGPCGRRAHGTGGQAMVAAEDERHRAVLERGERYVVQPLADIRDVADVVLPFVGPFLRLRNRRRQIAFVDHREAERGEVLVQACNAKCRRPHVHAAAVAAEIQGYADHMDGDHRSFTDTDMPSVPGFTIDV